MRCQPIYEAAGEKDDAIVGARSTEIHRAGPSTSATRSETLQIIRGDTADSVLNTTTAVVAATHGPPPSRSRLRTPQECGFRAVVDLEREISEIERHLGWGPHGRVVWRATGGRLPHRDTSTDKRESIKGELEKLEAGLDALSSVMLRRRQQVATQAEGAPWSPSGCAYPRLDDVLMFNAGSAFSSARMADDVVRLGIQRLEAVRDAFQHLATRSQIRKENELTEADAQSVLDNLEAKMLTAEDEFEAKRIRVELALDDLEAEVSLSRQQGE